MVPNKLYCCKPLKESLLRLFQIPGFQNCVKVGEIEVNYLETAYVMYMRVKSGRSFFSQKQTIGLMLNLSWFSPFKHVQADSIGAIYAVVLNLPRNVRFKKENLIFIGLIPNMKKHVLGAICWWIVNFMAWWFQLSIKGLSG